MVAAFIIDQWLWLIHHLCSNNDGDDVADWGEDDDADRLEKGWICHSLKDMRGESWISWFCNTKSDHLPPTLD